MVSFSKKSTLNMPKYLFRILFVSSFHERVYEVVNSILKLVQVGVEKITGESSGV